MRRQLLLREYIDHGGGVWERANAEAVHMSVRNVARGGQAECWLAGQSRNGLGPETTDIMGVV